jgi:hypothetical protein
MKNIIQDAMKEVSGAGASPSETSPDTKGRKSSKQNTSVVVVKQEKPHDHHRAASTSGSLTQPTSVRFDSFFSCNYHFLCMLGSLTTARRLRKKERSI